jgi:Arc/MetJ-type ribon-helix-helix transcriptional regulator
MRSFRREQVAAGRYSSEAEVAADTLKQYLADREALLALLDPAIAQLERGEGRPFDAEDTKRRGRSGGNARAHVQVIVSPLAQIHIDEIWDHIARESVPNADRFVDRIARLSCWPTNPRWGSRETACSL